MFEIRTTKQRLHSTAPAFRGEGLGNRGKKSEARAHEFFHENPDNAQSPGQD